MTDENETRPPPQNPAERFKKWLQLLEAHGARKQAGEQAPAPEPEPEQPE